MALLLQSHVLRTLIVFHGRRRMTTLQDIDATLRQDLFAPQVSIWLRTVLLALIALPLGLAVSYKLFVGGSSSRTMHLQDGLFGYTATPGDQRIGDGLTLLSSLYRPFWIEPALNRTYGFNLFIEDNSTAVILDSPYPSYLTYLQSHLSDTESLTLTTTVNATVARDTPIKADQRYNKDYWNETLSNFNHQPAFNGLNISGANNALLTGADFNVNFTIAYFSAWNTTLNESWYSGAIRIDNYRALYHATWNITSSNTSLVHAAPVEDARHWWQSTANQSIIQDQSLRLQEMFSNFLGEYDWHNRAGEFKFPYPDAGATSDIEESTSCPNDMTKCKRHLDVNTVPALSAAMIWARMTSLNGGDRPVRHPDRVVHTMYSKSAEDVVTVKYIPTLRRTWGLLVVLCTNPLVSVVCAVVKGLWLRKSLVGDGLNAVALLAAAVAGARREDRAEEKWDMLKGAERSGRLGRRIVVRFLEGRGDRKGDLRIVLVGDEAKESG